MVEFNVHHEDDIMVIFAITLERDAIIWFYGLLDESIDLVAMSFERFLLCWHDWTVDEIEQLAKEYDALIPRVHLELEEEIHEENINEDLIEEASQGSLLEGSNERLSNISIKDTELPHIYVTEKIPELLYAEEWNLPQVHLINNMCSVDQLEMCYDTDLYWSPINQWIEASCANSACQKFDSFFYPNNLVFSSAGCMNKL